MSRPLAVALVSGGFDSVTLAHHLKDMAFGLHLVSVDYGQRHVRELTCARQCALRLGATHDVLPLEWLKGRVPTSALTNDAVPVPHGHYAAETMKQTVVANRNMIMLALAAGIAVAKGAQMVATAVHAGDHAIYPDCRPEFVDAMNLALRLGNEGFAHPDFALYAPFVQYPKSTIASLAHRLGVPIQETWSCYEGGPIHCGRCGTCVERIEAIRSAGVPDPTAYEDTAFADVVLSETL